LHCFDHLPLPYPDLNSVQCFSSLIKSYHPITAPIQCGSELFRMTYRHYLSSPSLHFLVGLCLYLYLRNDSISIIILDSSYFV
jgi:hypothetical protein